MNPIKTDVVPIYINLGTKREVFILQKRDKMTQVRYVITELERWYKDEEFDRLFTLL